MHTLRELQNLPATIFTHSEIIVHVTLEAVPRHDLPRHSACIAHLLNDLVHSLQDRGALAPVVPCLAATILLHDDGLVVGVGQGSTVLQAWEEGFKYDIASKFNGVLAFDKCLPLTAREDGIAVKGGVVTQARMRF